MLGVAGRSAVSVSGWLIRFVDTLMPRSLLVVSEGPSMPLNCSLRRGSRLASKLRSAVVGLCCLKANRKAAAAEVLTSREGSRRTGSMCTTACGRDDQTRDRLVWIIAAAWASQARP